MVFSCLVNCFLFRVFVVRKSATKAVMSFVFAFRAYYSKSLCISALLSPGSQGDSFGGKQFIFRILQFTANMIIWVLG